MSPRRERATVAGTSPIADERQPLTPQVEPIIGGPADQPEPDRKPRTPVPPDSRSSGVPDPGSAGPKWAALERKEARLREDQVQALAALRRQVAAGRRDRSEIITDNTLIRVAVDLLLAHAHRLHGDTEEQLLHSVQPRRRPAPSGE